MSCMKQQNVCSFVFDEPLEADDFLPRGMQALCRGTQVGGFQELGSDAGSLFSPGGAAGRLSRRPAANQACRPPASSKAPHQSQRHIGRSPGSRTEGQRHSSTPLLHPTCRGDRRICAGNCAVLRDGFG